MLIWNYFDFSHWTVESLEAASGQKTKASHPLSQRSFLAGRLALTQLLKKQNLSPEINRNEEFGFLELHECFGSVAHTDEVCVAVISSCPVGIDIENRNRSVTHVLKKIASLQEIKQIDQFEDEAKSSVNDAGLFLWTAKEAFSKALGLGLREGIRDLRVSLEGHPPYSAESGIQSPMKMNEPVLSFKLLDDYLMSLCFEKQLSSKLLQLNPSENQSAVLPD